ncbi:hypothetical protein ACLOJK_010277 [Asimina triloba]
MAQSQEKRKGPDIVDTWRRFDLYTRSSVGADRVAVLRVAQECSATATCEILVTRCGPLPVRSEPFPYSLGKAGPCDELLCFQVILAAGRGGKAIAAKHGAFYNGNEGYPQRNRTGAHAVTHGKLDNCEFVIDTKK